MGRLKPSGNPAPKALYRLQVCQLSRSHKTRSTRARLPRLRCVRTASVGILAREPLPKWELEVLECPGFFVQPLADVPGGSERATSTSMAPLGSIRYTSLSISSDLNGINAISAMTLLRSRKLSSPSAWPPRYPISSSGLLSAPASRIACSMESDSQNIPQWDRNLLPEL
jgi:hypothetical protein